MKPLVDAPTVLFSQDHGAAHTRERERIVMYVRVMEEDAGLLFQCSCESVDAGAVRV